MSRIASSRIASRIPIIVHAIRAIRLVFVVAFVVMALGGSATAADDARSEWNDDRWVPSLALSLGFTSLAVNGSVASRGFVSLFGGVDKGPVRPFDRSQKFLNAPHVGGQFEMLSPAIPIPYVRPRVIFGGEVYNVSSQSRSIAREGDPQTQLTEPKGNQGFSAAQLLGRGSETAVDLDNVQFGAHIGLSFPVQLGDWRVSIKPSARYLKQKLVFTGIVSQGLRGPDESLPVPRTTPTNLILLQGNEDNDLHAVGPGLEIEIETGTIQNFAGSVFISGGAYRVLSNRNIRFKSTRQDSNGTPFTTYTGTFTADVDAWLYRANIGFRIKWLGAGSGWLFGLDR